MIPRVAKLFIYPIKSLDPVAVDRVTVLESGALKTDRRWGIFDASDKFVNGKRCAKIHSLRAKFNLDRLTVKLSAIDGDNYSEFSLNSDVKALESFLNDYFGFPVFFKENLEMGFPDDTDSPGPTIISTATLEAVTSWYPGLELEEVRRRFRANIEIEGVPPFWEDKLFIPEVSNFQIGEVNFIGVNPCQRCVVVTRNPENGEAYPNFQKTFTRQRRENLPEWTQKAQFNHFFRLAINTRLPSTEAQKTISLNDAVNI